MKPLVPATSELSEPELHAKAFAISTKFNIPYVTARTKLEEVMKEEVWVNDIYQVNVRRNIHVPGIPCAIVHLSIKRRDKKPVTDWRHKQFIKNQLVGSQCEGLELYPAEERMVDTANQYHVWVFADPAVHLPFGWHEGRITNEESCGGAQQRPFADTHQPT
jgi:hypothetical protein